MLTVGGEGEGRNAACYPRFRAEWNHFYAWCRGAAERWRLRPSCSPIPEATAAGAEMASAGLLGPLPVSRRL